MSYYDENRAREEAAYIIKTSSTVRGTAKAFGISKSTVHSDVTAKLKKIDFELYCKVREVLEENKRQRHIRGGLATKEKYAAIKNKDSDIDCE